MELFSSSLLRELWNGPCAPGPARFQIRALFGLAGSFCHSNFCSFVRLAFTEYYWVVRIVLYAVMVSTCSFGSADPLMSAFDIGTILLRSACAPPPSPPFPNPPSFQVVSSVTTRINSAF